MNKSDLFSRMSIGLGENTKTVGLYPIDGNLLDFCFARPSGTTFIWYKPTVLVFSPNMILLTADVSAAAERN